MTKGGCCDSSEGEMMGYVLGSRFEMYCKRSSVAFSELESDGRFFEIKNKKCVFARTGHA